MKRSGVRAPACAFIPTGFLSRSARHARAATVRPVAAFCLALTLFASVAPTQANELQLNVQVESQRVYLGESVQMIVTISGSSQPPEPDLSAIEGADIQSQGSHDQSRHSITIVQGRRREESYIARAFVYSVTPREGGSLQLGPIAVPGTSLSAEGPRIEVIPPLPHPRVNLEIVPSQARVIVDTAFFIELKIRVAKLDPPYADAVPLDRRNAPRLSIPFLDANFQLDGLEQTAPSEVLKTWLAPGQTPGFAVNNFTVSDDPTGWGFAMFENRPAIFAFETVTIDHENQAFWEYRLKVPYTARTRGTYRFGPVTLRGPIIIGADQHRQARMESVFVVADAVDVEVTGPPAEGRPSTFTGIVATNIAVRTTLDSTVCRLGDPLRLTIEVNGDFNRANARTPELSEQPGFTDIFRIYRESVQTTDTPTGRAFVYTVKPKREGTFEVPSLTVAFYRPDTLSYATATAAPLPFQVLPGDELSPFLSADGSLPPGFGAFGERDRLLMAPLIQVRLPVPSSLTWNRIAILAALGPLLALCGFALRHLFASIPFLRRYWRRRVERRRAGAVLLASETAGVAALYDSLRTVLAQAVGVATGMLTPGVARRKIEEARGDTELAIRVETLLHELQHALFTGVDAATGELRLEARSVTRLLAASRRGRKRKRANGGAAPRIPLWLFAAFLAGQLTPARGAPHDERLFDWSLAHTSARQATTPEALVDAAYRFASFSTDGTLSGEALYNVGTLLLAADQPFVARMFLLRAERALGGLPELRANLRLALRRIHDDETLPLPWYRIPFFWHFDVPVRHRAATAAASFSLFCIFAAVRRLRRPRHLVPLMLVTAILSLSALTSSIREAEDERRSMTALNELRERLTGSLDVNAPSPE